MHIELVNKYSPSLIVLLAIDNGTIVSYLIAEITVFNMRKLMHIHYLFTAPGYRQNGVATKMLNYIQDYALENNYSALSLTFDTYNKN